MKKELFKIVKENPKTLTVKNVKTGQVVEIYKSGIVE